jgi:ribosomal protein S18 acetylase RimI-like enzyme
MTNRPLETPTPQIRNMPLRPRAWNALLETPGASVIDAEGGTLALIPERGELHLYWAFSSTEHMRQLFGEMFEELRPEFTTDATDYVVLDLVEVHGKEWLDPILHDAAFDFFAEWLTMTHPSLDPNAIPTFPDGVKMRLAKAADSDRVHELWTEAYGELSDGPRAIDTALASASWIGVMEEGGEIVAFAANGEIVESEGRILTAAVAPEARRRGYGKLALAAAAYQLTTQGARAATVIGRPDVPFALRTASSLGFRPGRGGLEYRRPTDEDAIREQREAARVRGVKARFGGWR